MYQLYCKQHLYGNFSKIGNPVEANSPEEALEEYGPAPGQIWLVQDLDSNRGNIYLFKIEKPVNPPYRIVSASKDSKLTFDDESR